MDFLPYKVSFHLTLKAEDKLTSPSGSDFLAPDTAIINYKQASAEPYVYIRKPDGHVDEFTYTKENITRLRKNLDEVYQQAKEDLDLAEKRLEVAAKIQQRLREAHKEIEDLKFIK